MSRSPGKPGDAVLSVAAAERLTYPEFRVHARTRESTDDGRRNRVFEEIDGRYRESG